MTKLPKRRNLVRELNRMERECAALREELACKDITIEHMRFILSHSKSPTNAIPTPHANLTVVEGGCAL